MPSRRSESSRMARSVNRSQPLPAWEAGLPGETVRTALSRSTPRSAHGVRSPVAGRGSPRSVSSSLWMFWSEGGGRHPGRHGEAEPHRLPGAVVGVLAEDHDAHVVERRQRERVEDAVGRRIEPPPGRDLGDEERAELRMYGCSSSSPSTASQLSCMRGCTGRAYASGRSTFATTSRHHAPWRDGSSRNCDGLMQIDVKPRSTWAGIVASASSRSATESASGKRPRAPPTSSNPSRSRPASASASAEAVDVLVARASERIPAVAVADDAAGAGARAACSSRTRAATPSGRYGFGSTQTSSKR